MHILALSLICTNCKGKMVNFTVEKSDRHHCNQGTKVNTINNKIS